MENQVNVEQAYNSTMDSVNLINRMFDEGRTVEAEDLDTIERNKAHIEIMLGKDFWTEDQDMTPFEDAVALATAP